MRDEGREERKGEIRHKSRFNETREGKRKKETRRHLIARDSIFRSARPGEERSRNYREAREAHRGEADSALSRRNRCRGTNRGRAFDA